MRSSALALVALGLIACGTVGTVPRNSSDFDDAGPISVPSSTPRPTPTSSTASLVSTTRPTATMSTTRPTATIQTAPPPTRGIRGLFVALTLQFSIAYLVASPEGLIYQGLPGEGLAGFNVAVACAQSPTRCGRYRLQGTALEVTWSSNGSTVSGTTTSTGLLLSGTTYTAVSSSTGLRLDGVYGTDVVDAYGRTYVAGLAFKDGRFAIEPALLPVLGSSTTRTEILKGDYEIVDNTLILTFDVGGRLRVSFFVLPRVDLIYVNSRGLERL